MTFCIGCGTQITDGAIMCVVCGSRTAEDRRAILVANPFDSRNEISADARYIGGKIVSHTWIIFVLLPIVLGVLFAILTAK
jgi:hypothetical protein